MKRYQELLTLGVFKFNEVVELTGNKDTAKSLLRDYIEKEYVARIRRNLYVALNLETGAPEADRFAIGSNITDQSYISHHSAFEYQGAYNQIFSDVFVSSERKFSEFEFKGYNFRWVKAKFWKGTETSEQNSNVRVTDRERTVLDSIDDLNKYISLEELSECLSLLPYLNPEKLQEYLSCYGKKTMYQKTGFILEKFQEELKLSQEFFKHCQAQIGKNKAYLFPGENFKSQYYEASWRLIVPEKYRTLGKESGGHIGRSQ